ncbi:ATP-dependent DNA helicase RecQ [Thalassotalea insulae]|uniref:ATP-dependent DNA helicase RecQ n=1 Tax=Thalassotalea insulae TaxID=2056778 RepID=A0ABQ6GW36_9GAMM|nr:RecQ family ATP-dependent DNA helicase [Thalassotalea insulae]GLX79404.1 ATP-dependent DNA helicase RecQ [Thalassotalea insulae]
MTVDLKQQLRQSFGFDGFRSGQQQTIEQLLNGHSSLAIFPTGSGKSLCYQLTALNLPHLTLVVSPLIALMKDQLAFLTSKGIRAASLDSSLTGEQHQQVIADVRAGNVKILMVSVERFKNERFRQFIDTVAISMLVVDEAHCISEWGHNFRPDYLKLPHYQQELNIPLILLLTATATKKVKLDMAAKFSIAPEHIVQTGFYRDNLTLSVLSTAQSNKNNQLVSIIEQQSGAGIVYVTLQHSAEAVADFLQQNGVNARAYHAGFDSEKRQSIQQAFMSGEVRVIVATIAFGMGIDKSDIRFVIHYDLPKSIENYSQEIGRAGRDGLASHCITLADLDGVNVLENFVYGDTPESSGIANVLTSIANETEQQKWELQGLALSTASNIRQLPLKTLLVQLELKGVLKPLYSYFAEFKYKFIASEQDILASFDGERREFLAAIFNHSRFKKIWGEPDFEQLMANYQCQRSRVVSALEYLQEQHLIALESKKMTEVYQVNQEALAAPELVEQLQGYFLQKEQSEINRIAALVRFFQLDKCLSRNLALYFDDSEAPEHCGHCSVCHGNIAKLSYSQQWLLPDDELLTRYIDGLVTHMTEKGYQQLSLATITRFLTGLMVPIFTRNRVKQLSGFASCEHIRFTEVKSKVEQLSTG